MLASWIRHAALVLGATLAGTGASVAQSAGGDDNSPVKEFDAVTVTATQTQYSAFDVPASVTVIGSDQLQREQARDFGDIFTDLPGVDMDGGPRSIGEQPNIRGLGATRNVVTIDGARQNFESGHRGRLFLDPDLLKQVEVLSGPSSALYGSGALGGVIAMTTKDAADLLRPGENVGGVAKLGYQSANSDRLGAGTLFGRVENFDALGAFSFRSSDNVRLDNNNDLPESARDVTSGFGKAGVTIADFHRLEISAMSFKDDGSVPSNPAGTPSAILVILHDLNTAALYADRIAVLKGGRILGTGTQDEVLTGAIIGEAFGVAVDIWRHPSANCPLIVALPY